MAAHECVVPSKSKAESTATEEEAIKDVLHRLGVVRSEVFGDIRDLISIS